MIKRVKKMWFPTVQETIEEELKMARRNLLKAELDVIAARHNVSSLEAQERHVRVGNVSNHEMARAVVMDVVRK